jgi:hypothetical protein
MNALQIHPDLVRIDLNADEAQELLNREGYIPSNEWGLIRPKLAKFVRASAMAQAHQLIDQQRREIEDLKRALSETVVLTVEGDVS